jgi:hypothetical protein
MQALVAVQLSWLCRSTMATATADNHSPCTLECLPETRNHFQISLMHHVCDLAAIVQASAAVRLPHLVCREHRACAQAELVWVHSLLQQDGRSVLRAVAGAAGALPTQHVCGAVVLRHIKGGLQDLQCIACCSAGSSLW